MTWLKTNVTNNNSILCPFQFLNDITSFGTKITINKSLWEKRHPKVYKSLCILEWQYIFLELNSLPISHSESRTSQNICLYAFLSDKYHLEVLSSTSQFGRKDIQKYISLWILSDTTSFEINVSINKTLWRRDIPKYTCLFEF